MKILFLLISLLISVCIHSQTRFDVSSKSEFTSAQQDAIAGDTIVWMPGVYTDIRQDVDKEGLIITAEPFGSVLFTGASRAVINANNTSFSGFQYIGGVIGSLDVIRVFGSDVLIDQVNIQNYTSHKYLVVDEDSKRTTIRYCNFENRLNLDDKNILSILVDNEPGYHKIQYCSFKNFDGIGNDQGIEPIRIGVSSQGKLDSRTIVEYCYFTQCNGDGEIISHKSRQNVYRYNTFENNPVAELVLRHGDEGIVYGNFFLNNMGGIRVREGSDHFIYNNYFEGNDRRTIFLQNDPSDPLSNIHIYHNSVINTEEIILGGNGNNPPTNVVIANNVFTDPLEKLFVEDTKNETWINNLSFGNLGIDLPDFGLVDSDPLLVENLKGFFQPAENSPLIEAANDGYPSIPLYPEMDYDNALLLDLMKDDRPILIEERAIGASEFSSTTLVEPHVNEFNTGPFYLFENLVNYIAANVTQLYIGSESDSKNVIISSNIEWAVSSDVEWITIDNMSGTGDGNFQLNIEKNQEDIARSGVITIEGNNQLVMISVFQDAGEVVGIIENFEEEFILFPNPNKGIIFVTNLPQEIRRSVVELIDLDGKSISCKEYRLNENAFEIKLDNLMSGMYLLNIKFMDNRGIPLYEVNRRIVRE